MLVTEQSFQTHRQQPNAGQVARLKLLPIDAVLAISPPNTWPILAGPLTVSKYGLAVASGAKLTELVFPPDGCSFSEVSTTDEAGAVWSPTLLATVPKNQPELLAWIDANQTTRWLAIWLDRNGYAHLAGEPGNGLRLEISRSIAATNAVGFTIKGRSWHPAWFLETFDSATLFADVDFDQSFDYSFNA